MADVDQLRCPTCGAPRTRFDRTCSYCEHSLPSLVAGPEVQDPNSFFAAGHHWRLQVGIPRSAHDPELIRITYRFSRGLVAMRLKKLDGELGPAGVITRLYRAVGAGADLVTASTSRVAPDCNVLHKAWEITEPGSYQIQVLQPPEQFLLAQAGFTVS